MFIASLEWRVLEYSKASKGKIVTCIIQNHDFWSQARNVIELLEPFVRTLCLVDGDGSTFGYLYQAIEMARKLIEFKSALTREKYGHVKTLLKKRRNDNRITPLYAAVAFLNPTYMLSDSFSESWEMKHGIDYIFETLVAEDGKQVFMERVQLYRMMYAPLFTLLARAMLKISNPRKYLLFTFSL